MPTKTAAKKQIESLGTSPLGEYFTVDMPVSRLTIGHVVNYEETLTSYHGVITARRHQRLTEGIDGGGEDHPDDHWVDDGNGGMQTPAGSVHFSVVHVDVAVCQGGSVLRDIFNLDPRVYDVGHDIMNFDAGYLKTKVSMIVGHDFRLERLIVFHKIKIAPQWSGRCVGLAAMQRILREYGGRGAAAALSVVPEQYWGLDEKSHKQVCQQFPYARPIRKLKTHYSHIGFRVVPGTDTMICRADTIEF